jgi:dipeptidyl aminopeptidase/acylaminoacyl peptidase
MNSFPLSKFAFIVWVFAMTACNTQTHPETATPTSFVPPSFTSTSTPKTEVITTENISQLVLLKQLSMGTARGDPIYLPDGKHIIQATTSGIYNFDITSFPNGEKIIPPGDLINYYGEGINISPDGKTLVAGDALFNIQDGHKLIDLERPSDASEWEGAHTSNFSPDGSMVARGYENVKDWNKWRVAIWRISDGRLLHIFETASRSAANFSPDSHLMAVEFIDQRKPYIHLYDLQSGTLLSSWPGERSAFLPENRLAIESEDTIRIFELETGKSKHAFFGKLASFSADGQLIVFLAFDELKVYRIADEQLITTLKGSFKDYDYALLDIWANQSAVADI